MLVKQVFKSFVCNYHFFTVIDKRYNRNIYIQVYLNYNRYGELKVADLSCNRV